MTAPALEAQWLLWALLLGAGLGVVYGFLRYLRPRALGDLIFVGCAFWAWVYLGFGICAGQLRFGYTLGLLLGAVLWEVSFGKLLRPVFRSFWRGIGKIWGFLTKPLQKIWIFFRKNCKLLLAEAKKWVTIRKDYVPSGSRTAGGVIHGKEKNPCEAGVWQKQYPDQDGRAGAAGSGHRHPHRSVRRHKKRPAGL